MHYGNGKNVLNCKYISENRHIWSNMYLFFWFWGEIWLDFCEKNYSSIGYISIDYRLVRWFIKLFIISCFILADAGLSVLSNLSKLQHLNLSSCSKLTDSCLQHITGETASQKASISDYHHVQMHRLFVSDLRTAQSDVPGSGPDQSKRCRSADVSAVRFIRAVSAQPQSDGHHREHTESAARMCPTATNAQY